MWCAFQTMVVWYRQIFTWEALILKGRVLFTALLILVFCLTAVFPVGAVQPTAKDLVLVAIKNFDLGINKGFYEKSTGEANLEVTRFSGSLQEKLGDYSGAKIRFVTQLDDSNKAIKLSYDTDIKGVAHDGDIYLIDDKVILTKDIFNLLQEFGFDPFENRNVSLAEAPEYLYLVDPQFKAVWEQMASYQSQQLPEEYIELLLFMVEAIPDEYFTLSPSKVTIQLDQDGFEETIVNLLTKMKNESDRFAEIIISGNQYSFEQMGIDPAEMKREMASGMENMTVPTREEIRAITSLIEVKDFTFEHSLLPGGPKRFNVDIGFNAPDSSVNGSFNIAVDVAGKQDNLEGSYRMAGKYNDINGPKIDIAYDSKFSYADTVAHSDMIVNVTARDNTTGELMLDLGLVSDSVSRINTSLVLNVPELTSNNSLDITEFIPTPGTSVTVEQPAELNLNLVVNGVNIEAKPGIGKQGELAVPARAVLEQLGYQVEWVEPNEIQVTSDDKAISLFVNQNSLTVNGEEKRSLTTSPYLEAGNAMVPLSFITDQLGAKLDFVERNIVITN